MGQNLLPFPSSTPPFLLLPISFLGKKGFCAVWDILPCSTPGSQWLLFFPVSFPQIHILMRSVTPSQLSEQVLELPPPHPPAGALARAVPDPPCSIPDAVTAFLLLPSPPTAGKEAAL